MCKLIFNSIFLLFLTAYPQTITVSRSAVSDVKFYAEATFNDFEGSTSSVEGYIKWDSSYSKKSDISLKVNLDSLDTGIELRNSHMRNNFLETGKYPTAEFDGRIISFEKISNIESMVKVKGVLEIHGIKKEIETEGRIFNYGILYKVTTKFDIYLSDFGIDRPSFLFNKVHNKITIQVSVYFSEAGR
jgi:polyisoprenoid-binding protein YceI